MNSLARASCERAPLRQISRPAWPWLLGGATLLAIQAAGMGFAIGAFGDATAVNIVYSSRGLWAVLAVWWIGHWFKNDEQHLGGAVLRLRLWGAGLMLAAPETVLAGAGGAEFQGAYDMLTGWMTGILGRIIAITFIVVGLVAGVMRQSIMGFVVGIAAALGAFVAPDIIDNIVTATLPIV